LLVSCIHDLLVSSISLAEFFSFFWQLHFDIIRSKDGFKIHPFLLHEHPGIYCVVDGVEISLPLLNLGFDVPDVLGSRKRLQDQNIIFKSLSDLLGRSHSITFEFTVLLVSDDVEVLLSPSLVDFLDVFLVLGLSFGFDNDFIDLIFAILKFKIENFT
jgi:hypothetical protein